MKGMPCGHLVNSDLARLVGLIYGGSPEVGMADTMGSTTVIYGDSGDRPVSSYLVRVREAGASFTVEHHEGRLRRHRMFTRADAGVLAAIGGIEPCMFSIGPHHARYRTLSVMDQERYCVVLEARFVMGRIIWVLDFMRLSAPLPAVMGWRRWRSYVPGVNINVLQATMAL